MFFRIIYYLTFVINLNWKFGIRAGYLSMLDDYLGNKGPKKLPDWNWCKKGYWYSPFNWVLWQI